jgi:hypothetical protein
MAPKAQSPWEIMAERNRQPITAPEAPPAEAGRGWQDPVEAGVSWLADAFEHMTPRQRHALGMPAGPLPDWMKTAGRFIIPQNTPEALLTLAMLPMGGPLAARGVPFAAKLAQKGAQAAMKRALATGALTSVGGTLTGHDPLHSFGVGAIGRPLGELIGHTAGKVVKGIASSRLFTDVTPRLATVFRETIGQYLPQNATDAGVLREVISDSASKRVGAAINAAKQRLAKTPVNVIDLKPVVTPEHGVVYAWPTKAGRFPEGLPAPGPTPPGPPAGNLAPGVPTVDMGNVWPPFRHFEDRIGPGEGLAPYGALERPGELARVPPKGPKRLGPGEGGAPLTPAEEVEFGPLWDAVDDAYQKVELALRENPGDGALIARQKMLADVRQKLVDRTNDPDLKRLFRDYGLTKSLRDLFWGAREAPAKFGEDVVKELIDDAGNLTQKGVKIVYDRLNTDAPNIARQLGEQTTQALKDAVHLQPDLGLASPTPGQGPQIRLHATPGGVAPSASLEGARVPSYPGWEGTRTAAERLVPDVLKVLGAPVPAKVGAEAEAQAAEPPADAGPVSLSPGKLRDPYALGLPAPPAAEAPTIPPPVKADRRDPTAGWFKGADTGGEAAPAGEDSPDALEIFLETTKKPGE